MNNRPRRIMIIAGEASGDAHAASLVNAFRGLGSDTIPEFFGMTGPKMREAGVETIVDADGLAIVGVPEVAKALPRFLSARRKLLQAAKDHRPDAVVLVDFPEFSLKLANPLKKLGIKVVYYISPQLWAWRRYRIRTIADKVDLLLSILPFEQAWYERRGVLHVEYVGNPLAKAVRPKLSKSEFCTQHGLRVDDPLVAMLPGSRATEIDHHLPVMLTAAAEMLKQKPTLQFVIALARGRSPAEVKRAFESLGHEDSLLQSACTVVNDQTFEALAAADVAAVCSGTATLEAGIIGTPMVIVYKGSALNYRLMMPLIKVEHFGLINLIAGERLVPELIQNDFKPKRLAKELSRLLEPEENATIRDKLRSAVESLGEGGGSEKAAKAIERLLSRDTKTF